MIQHDPWKTTIVPPNESRIVQELKIETKGQYKISYIVQHGVILNLKQVVLSHIRKGIKKGEFAYLGSLPDDLKDEMNNPPLPTWIDLLIGSDRQSTGVGFENTISGSWGMWINTGDVIKIRLYASKHHRKVVATLDAKRLAE